jgi:hypothetical protein
MGSKVDLVADEYDVRRDGHPIADQNRLSAVSSGRHNGKVSNSDEHRLHVLVPRLESAGITAATHLGRPFPWRQGVREVLDRTK